MLKQNPLLINKIVAEKLSDKIQVMMVPSDGKFFFANDVMKSFGAPGHPESEARRSAGGAAGTALKHSTRVLNFANWWADAGTG